MQPAANDEINQVLQKASQLLSASNISKLEKNLAELQQKTLKPNFWQTPTAKEISQEMATLQKKLEQLQQVIQLQKDLQAFLDLITEERAGDQKLDNETRKNISQLNKLLKELELSQFLSGKYDKHGIIISIHAGQGGTEAMDWAQMLKRMYLRYFERKKWKHTFVSESRGEEAGIKSSSYEVAAPYAYGYLKHEAGTHRLVRLSPFNADKLRQTSFALVEVLPLIEADSPQIELKDSELEWHFTRAGGAGGQSVNKVNTAVELKHLPTNIVVKCREERSQIQNKERALKILKAKLAKLEEEKGIKELAKVKGKHQDASWGTQIRNYVLHPYKLVKDTRTKVETSDTEGVLDGDLDLFVQEEVRRL